MGLKFEIFMLNAKKQRVYTKMTRNPLKKTRKVSELANFEQALYKQRNITELSQFGQSAVEREMQIDETHYVKAKPLKNPKNRIKNDWGYTKSKSKMIKRNVGHVTEKLNRLLEDREQSRLKTAELTKSEKIWWNRTLVLKAFIHRDLRDFCNMQRATALKQLYQLILKQQSEQCFEFKAFYEHICSEYKDLFRDRLRE